MDQSTLEMTWAWVGQVDLFWTNIDGKLLMLGLKIEVKVNGLSITTCIYRQHVERINMLNEVLFFKTFVQLYVLNI